MSRVRDKPSNFTINKTKILLQVKQEVSSILEMMTEYLKRVTDDTCGFENLIQSFSQVSAFLFLRLDCNESEQPNNYHSK